jgi:PPK2 family polyphosphate:nucleotide phosphotransferase
MNGAKLSACHRVDDGADFRLAQHDPRDTGSIGKDDARELLAEGVAKLAEMQEKLYAQDRWSLLVILQGMDASGKDGAIKHVLSGVNPQGCDVISFKAPSAQELDHDFLWRCVKEIPERGRIGIFNRSYYEDVLVPRVHKDVLAAQKLPRNLMNDDIWSGRFESIRAFESHLARNGTAVVKILLHMSKDEQKQRFLDRLEEPEKHWKFAHRDMTERRNFNRYMEFYEEIIRETAAPHAPWYVVPADRKWYARLVIAAAMIDTLENLDLAFPTVSEDDKKLLEVALKTLKSED